MVVVMGAILKELAMRYCPCPKDTDLKESNMGSEGDRSEMPATATYRLNSQTYLLSL